MILKANIVHVFLLRGLKLCARYEIMYHVSDAVVEELASRGLVKVSDHPESHRADVAVI